MATRTIGGSTNKGYASSGPQRKPGSTRNWWGGGDEYGGDAGFGAGQWGSDNKSVSNKLEDYKGGPRLKVNDRPMTDKERTALKLKQGIAPTAKNMGSLGVKYRADEDAAHAAGKQSVGDKRAQKVIDTRAADDYKYNVTNPERRRQGAIDAAKRKQQQEMGAMGRAWARYARGPGEQKIRSKSYKSGKGGGAPNAGASGSSKKGGKTWAEGGMGADEKRKALEDARVAGYGFFPGIINTPRPQAGIGSKR